MHAKPWVALFGACLLCACGSTDSSRPLSLNALYENPNVEGYLKADKVIEFEFPRDHGEHRDFQTEWWYVVGVVKDTTGREFGFQFTLFRQALQPHTTAVNDWREGQIYMAHFAIADIENEEHIAFERFSRGHDRLSGVTTEPFAAFIEDWGLKSTSDAYSPLALHTSAESYALELSLEATKSPVLHGEDGLSWKSPTNASYYYSIPRLETKGTLTTPEGVFEVSGSAWLDREWSTGILDENYSGWNWLALHLNDSQDVVLFNLVPANENTPVMPVGMLVDATGQRTRLNPDDWNMTPIRHWKTWPVAWELEMHDRTLVVDAAFDDQLMSTSVRYWEGVVFVHEDGNRVGEGYLELTGY